MPTTAIRLTFSDAGDFVAESRAVALLEDCGFSVGRKQGHAPRGILFGLYDIQKWRNLSVSDREALHGVMTAGGRAGPVVVEIFDRAPEEGGRLLRKASEGYSVRPSDLGSTEATCLQGHSQADLQASIAPDQVRVLARAEYPIEQIGVGQIQAGPASRRTERAIAPSSLQPGSQTSRSWGKV